MSKIGSGFPTGGPSPAHQYPTLVLNLMTYRPPGLTSHDNGPETTNCVAPESSVKIVTLSIGQAEVRRRWQLGGGWDFGVADKGMRRNR